MQKTQNMGTRQQETNGDDNNVSYFYKILVRTFTYNILKKQIV